MKIGDGSISDLSFELYSEYNETTTKELNNKLIKHFLKID